MWVGDDQEEAWDRCRWAPAACANHIADTMRRNPSHGMPDTMTRLPQSRDDYDYYAGHLSSDAEHTGVPDGRADRRLHARRAGGEGARKAQELFELGIDEISCAYLNGAFDQMEHRRPRDHPGQVATGSQEGTDEAASASTSAARSPT